jgi:hypothetical protein
MRTALRGKRRRAGLSRVSNQHVRDYLAADQRADEAIRREALEQMVARGVEKAVVNLPSIFSLEEAARATESEAGVALSRPVAPGSGRPPGEGR